jgi:hypothetical protein
MADADDDQISDYLWDGTGAPDPEVAKLESILSPMAHTAPLRDPDVIPIASRRRKRTMFVVGVVGTLAAAAAVTIVIVKTRGASGGCAGGAGMMFSASEPVRCNGHAATSGTLAVGGWLETAGGNAEIKHSAKDFQAFLDLKPGSRLELKRSDDAEHRLALERGELHARVTAIPRLFVVETPSATAVDLGCEYDLEVDDNGDGSLCVTSGQVELARDANRIVVVPMYACASFSKTRGVGLPVANDSSDAFKALVAKYERGEIPASQLFGVAEPVDRITVANLLDVAEPYEREALFDKLYELAPAPEDVLRDAIIGRDPEAIRKWREAIVGEWNVAVLSPPKTKPDFSCVNGDCDAAPPSTWDEQPKPDPDPEPQVWNPDGGPTSWN